VNRGPPIFVLPLIQEILITLGEEVAMTLPDIADPDMDPWTMKLSDFNSVSGFTSRPNKKTFIFKPS
jgi:hypothetical protein